MVDVDLTAQPGTNGVQAAGHYVSGFPGGALTSPATLTGYVDGSGVEHVFFTDAAPDIVEFYHNSSAWSLGFQGLGRYKISRTSVGNRSNRSTKIRQRRARAMTTN